MTIKLQNSPDLDTTADGIYECNGGSLSQLSITANAINHDWPQGCAWLNDNKVITTMTIKPLDDSKWCAQICGHRFATPVWGYVGVEGGPIRKLAHGFLVADAKYCIVSYRFVERQNDRTSERFVLKIQTYTSAFTITMQFCRMDINFYLIMMRIETFSNRKMQQIVGPRQPMCWTIFGPANFNANPLNILVHLQLIWFHNASQLKVLLHLLPFGRKVKGSFEFHNFGGKESVSGLVFAPIESPPKTY